MNILMVGSGAAGSWQMRGEQLGRAIGARVTTAPTADDWRWADLVILVKRAASAYAQQAHAARVPVVWDALDFWRQPRDNDTTREQALALFHEHARVIRPALVVCATQAMATDLGGVYLPHHCWHGLTSTPVRDHVQMVAYQGGEVYLGRWRAALEQACARRGWTFVVNPSDLRDADILIALRDGIWDGWMCREWKSGVKLVNAIAAGRPVITQDSAAARELGPSHPVIDVIERPADLDRALDTWTFERRDAVALESAATPFELTYSVASVAQQYRRILDSVRTSCAA